MSDNDATAAYTLTFKGGKGYDAPWVVVRGDTEAQLHARLDALGVDILARAAGVAEVFQSLVAGGSAAPQASAGGALSSQPAQAAPQSAPPAASTPPQQNEAPLRFHPEGKKCSACGGALYYQEWVSKQNKPCKAYKCDGKGMGHDLEWAS